ncbi:MAG: TlpA family protein disulfide reductase [Gammaproteobacteria bacterium]|nr:MAG: TlpA family protein disulfide reductase [Gammaproteobacteria bacterium]
MPARAHRPPGPRPWPATARLGALLAALATLGALGAALLAAPPAQAGSGKAPGESQKEAPAGAASAPGADPWEALGLDRPKVRLPAPPFRLPRLGGGEAALEAYRGRVVLINFWATWCRGCAAEMPALERLWRRYRERGLVVLGVSADRGDPGVVRAFLRRLPVSFPILLDRDGAVRRRYEVWALPFTYLVGRDGRLRARAVGERDWDGPAARAVIEALLAEPGPGEAGPGAGAASGPPLQAPQQAARGP